MRGVTWALVLSLALTATQARAEPGWQVDVRGSYTILGAHRATGGIMPVLAARHLWWVRGWGLGVGAEAGVFGLSSSGHWLGILAGPVLSAETRPLTLPLDLGHGSVGVSIAGDFGRIPVCNAWDLCVRYWGIFPRIEMALGYLAGEHFTATLGLSARIVRTLIWTGLSWEPTVGGRFAW